MFPLIPAVIVLMLLIITFFILALYMCSIFPYGKFTPPFVPTNRKLVELIVTTLDPQSSSVVYELGAGDMRISLEAWKRQPTARFTGIEKHFFPRMLAKWYIWRAGARAQVSVREENLYKTDLHTATHLYCYLFPVAMQKLHEKFKQELHPGAVVVSLDFDIKDKQPERTIDLKPYKLKLGTTLYVYRY